MTIKAELRSFIALSLTTIGVLGCMVQSPEPDVEDIVKVSAPTFGGKTETLISSASQSYNLNGECDPAAISTEYSIDQQNWIPIKCTQGKFTITFVLNGYIDIYARSSGKFTPTSVSHARVRFLLPPTSNAIVAGGSSKSSNSDLIGPGTQNMMAASFEGTEMQSASMKVQTLLPRIVYDHQ